MRMTVMLPGVEKWWHLAFEEQEPHVKIGDAIIQDIRIYPQSETAIALLSSLKSRRLSSPEDYAFTVDAKEALRALGAKVESARSGVWEGWGHGRETLTITDQEGNFCFERTQISHCEGPGYSCSYSHGPWITYELTPKEK